MSERGHAWAYIIAASLAGYILLGEPGAAAGMLLLCLIMAIREESQ